MIHIALEMIVTVTIAAIGCSVRVETNSPMAASPASPAVT